ncbi:MBL fold metallo-hydrolase [Aquimarina celericrescens]|uniref:MBL fold metallo-hydrolase n=1 Tax=Aquimarina celericrescens TaxID=1964542 RepID=A0ABW5AUT9_9FLAO|nr:MBL fold metallo-hydrolase [Aquimarina celericrescens]
MLKILFLLTTVVLSFFYRAQENISITYTGNMGVYISGSQFSVLIDGLHTKYGDDYLFPTDSLVNKITTQLRPDAILFTHYHGDHYNSELSEKYLKTNHKSVLFGPEQVTKSIGNLKNNIYTIGTKDYIKQNFNLGNTRITGLKIDHAGKKHLSVENVGYILNIDNKKILHVGDTDWLVELNLFPQLKLSDEAIDIAILPYWMLLHDNASVLIQKYINPEHVIATHISPRIIEQELLDLKKKYPKIYFLKTLEKQIQL